MNPTFATLAFVAATATAQTEQPQDICHVIGNLAEQIMENRQAGISMSEMMAVSAESELAQLLVIEAYNIPRMSHPDNQRREVEDFRNMAEVLCYQAQ